MHSITAKSGRVNLGGVDFDFLKQADIPSLVEGWRRSGHRGYVTLVNPHSVMMCRRDERMREATRAADLTLPDGVGVVLGARLLGHGKQFRVTGPSLMLHLCDAGRASGLRHYFYGGGDGVAERLADRLSAAFPGLCVAGTQCPPFRELNQEEDLAAIARMNAAKPDVVWVGLGAPKQEKWMAAHIYRVRAAALVGVGAAFDFHSGTVRWAPRWVRAIGCEWAYRLLVEPRRMWRRNLDSPLFLGCLLGHAATRFVGRLAGAGRRVQAALALGGDNDIGGPSGGGGVSAAVGDALRPKHRFAARPSQRGIEPLRPVAV